MPVSTCSSGQPWLPGQPRPQSCGRRNCTGGRKRWPRQGEDEWTSSSAASLGGCWWFSSAAALSDKGPGVSGLKHSESDK